MDARWIKAALCASVFTSLGATYKTPNFVVNAPTANAAKSVAMAAEHYRDELAVEWLGKKLPKWYRPCQVNVKVGQIGAGGATTFAFDRGEVFGWQMNIQGTLERLLDSVVPHEVSHTIFACHFRRPLPRWADEGAATLVEHESERRRQLMLMGEVLNNSRKRIPLKHLLSMTEYPRDMQNVLTLYAEGYSLADYLVQQGGKSNFLKFLQFAHNPRGPYGWDRALQRHYRFSNVDQLESQWNGWVMAGSPRLPKDQMLADANTRGPAGTQPGTTIRSQSPDEAPAGQFAQAPRRTHPRGANLEFPDLRQRHPASRAGKPAVGPAQWIPIDGSGLRDSSGARYPQSTLERRFAPNQPSEQTRNTNQERNIPLPVTHRRSEKLSLPAARESNVSSGRFTYRLPLSGERITGDSASSSVARLPSLSPPNE